MAVGRLSAGDARRQLTKAVEEAFRSIPKDNFVFSSYFTPKFKDTFIISYDTVGVKNFAANDQVFGGDGSYNVWDLQRENLLILPYYHERMDAVREVKAYFEIFGISNDEITKNSNSLYADATEEIAFKRVDMANQILRRYEIQAAQVFLDGVVRTKMEGDYDFGRNAASIVDLVGAGGYWTTTTVDPAASISIGIQRMILDANLDPGQIFDVWVGQKAWDAYVANPIIQAKYDIKHYNIGDINSPIKGKNGAKYLGDAVVSTYNVRFWSHEATYIDKDTNSVTRYLPIDKVIILPSIVGNNDFVQFNGGIPYFAPDAPFAKIMSGSVFYNTEYKDYLRRQHIFQVESRALMVPKAKHAIHTIKAVA